MKNFYIVCETEENGLFYAFILRVSDCDNIKNRLENIRGLKAANLCNTKKRAVCVCNAWRDRYRENGVYMFENAGF